MREQNARKPRTSNINLQAMEVFCEVVRLQSFSRAGASFGISQSAVSQLVAHLEDELGFHLIDRRRRPLRTTAEGEIYYQGCQEVLHGHRTTLDEILGRRKGSSGVVRVASIYSVGLHTLNAYIGEFMAAYEDARIHLEYLHPVKVYSAVLNDEADLGVVSYPTPHRSLRVVPWLEERMVLACPTNHRLAGRGTMPVDELQGERFVAFVSDLKIRREVDRALRANHVQIEVVSEFDNIETIKQALEISGAVSILPRPSLQREVERGTLVEVELAGFDVVRPVGVIHKRRRKQTSTTRAFLRTLLASEARTSVSR